MRSLGVLTLGRAAVDATAALAITFIANHSVGLGLGILAAWLGVGAVLSAVAALLAERGRLPLAADALVALCGAVVSVVEAGSAPSVLVLVVTIALVLVLRAGAGVLLAAEWETAQPGLRRDALIELGITLLCVVVILLVPREPVHPVGTFGLYLAASAVFRGIAGSGYLTAAKQGRMESREGA